MTTLNDIIDVDITRNTKTVQRAAFGIPCFLAAHTQFTERAKEYNSLTEAVTDGFTSSTSVYKALAKYFGQDISIDKVVVGRRKIPTITLTYSAADDTVYSFKLNGTLITYTSGSSATTATITTGLKAAISGASLTGFTVGASTTTIVLTVTGDGISVTDVASTVTQTNAAVAEGWDDSIEAVRNINDTWYHLNTESHVEADILDIAAYVETLDKKYSFSSQDSDIITSATDDIFSQLKALGYNNTFYMYSATADSVFPECSRVGRFAPEQPGSNVWVYKTLIGVTADKLTSAQATYVHNKNGATYETIGGVSANVGNLTASGENIDVIIFVDWLKARTQEGIWFLQVNSQKVGYTPAGAAAIEGEIRKVLAEGIQVGGLADDPAPVVSVPNILNLSSSVRAYRNLPDVTFEARLAGAILTTTIRGNVYA